MYMVQFLEQACIAFLHPEMLVHKQAGIYGKAKSKRGRLYLLLGIP